MSTELRVDPLFSFIIPVYKVPAPVFKRNLMSVTKQDYQNYEIIVVFDGPDEGLLKVANEFTEKNKNLKIVEIPHSGACVARNEGFKESKGEIVSFFNSDYIAKPGMVRMWVDSLLDHPECGFAYGAYEYNTASRNAYWSKDFNEYDLEQANFIDCGFPLWRKYVVEWDKDVKSLQDWDFWIRVVKTHKVKGYYLKREISFVAEPPREGGLSMDSHGNWVERVTFVREKNGIKTNDMVVTSVGAISHAREISKMLGADFRDPDTILKPHNYKSVYMIGFYFKPTDQSNMHPMIMKNFHNQVKIVHFVGADIHWLKSFSHRDLKIFANVFNTGIDHILCETKMAQDELKELGINSVIMPIPPYNDYEVKPLPEKFSVAIFLTNNSDFDKYCQQETLSIVRALPNIQFNAYGDACKDMGYPNMNHVGNLTREEWKQFVYGNSCYLRFVRHDTRPMATDEFVMAGRRVITNIPNTGTDVISTAGDLSKGEWDIFQTGLNDYNWPKTKKAIVQKILNIRKNEWPLEDKLKESNMLKKILNRDNYIFEIREMSKSKKEAVVINS